VSSLFAALNTASGAMDVLQQAIGVTQDNVSNASTPGFVTQTLHLAARAFDPSDNLWGGVTADGVVSSRNVFAEQQVWSANEQVGQSTQEATSLNALQGNFDVSGTSGVTAALSGLYSAFSAWSSNPTDVPSRQEVISQQPLLPNRCSRRQPVWNSFGPRPTHNLAVRFPASIRLLLRLPR
jgi:flagellar hook-associated protein 1 FlgK